MEPRTLNIDLRYFTQSNAMALQSILRTLQEAGRDATIYPGYSAAEVAEIFDQHKALHGISIGGLYDGENRLLGLGGFHYLEETGLYEVVSDLIPEHEDNTAYALEFLEHKAFRNLSMDRICARALPGTVLDNALKANGFAFAGERAFISTGTDRIWNYYELENDGNLVAAEGYSSSAHSDWDAVF